MGEMFSSQVLEPFPSQGPGGAWYWSAQFLSISKRLHRSHEQPATASGRYPVRDWRDAGHVGSTFSCNLAAATEAAAVSDGLYCKRTIRKNEKSSVSHAVAYTQILDS